MKQFILTHKVLCIVLACVLLAGVTCAIVLPIALKHEHAYATEWSNDATNHWHAATCEHTDLKKDEAAHDFGEGVTEGDVTTYTCKVCGFKKTETVTPPPARTYLCGRMVARRNQPLACRNLRTRREKGRSGSYFRRMDDKNRSGLRCKRGAKKNLHRLPEARRKNGCKFCASRQGQRYYRQND